MDKKIGYHISVLPECTSKNHPYRFDEDGVIMAKIPYTQHYDYHAMNVASYAILNMDKPNVFLAQIRWLVDNIDDDGAYRHNFKFPFYDFEVPWIGGLNQGLAISALVRAYQKYDKKTYLDIARKAFECLSRDIEEDGCIFTDDNNFKWIEEYPVHPLPHILNGFIYALFAINDLYKETKSKKVLRLWEDGMLTLSSNIKRYDMGYWSRYSILDKQPATMYYHKIHIEQLHAISLTKNTLYRALFVEYADKWQNNLESTMNRLMAKLMRNIIIIKKHGLIGSYNRYNERKRWLID